MIPFSDISDGKTREMIFTWRDEDTGQVRMWAVDRLNKWLPTSGIKVHMGLTDEKRAEMFLRERGIEMHRLEWLCQHHEELTRPGILMRSTCPVSPEFPEGLTDLTLDGHHRYVALTAIGSPVFPFYHLTEEQASEFEISDIPPVPKERFDSFVATSFSGIGDPK
jgi:hypothetical protein